MQTTLKSTPPGLSYACSHCGSDQTQRKSVIHSSGTSVVETRSTGVAVGLTKGGFVPAVGSSTSIGVQQTQLAQQVAPPERTPTFKIVFFTPFVGVALGLVAWFIAGVALVASSTKANDVPGYVLVGTFLLVQVLGGALAVLSFRHNRDRWPSQHAAWERQWLCLRCGQSFEPAERRAAA